MPLRSLKKVDKPVYIQDIIIQQKAKPPDLVVGEFNFSSTKPGTESRLLAHIEELITDAANVHLANNAKSTITRLLTHEFSFYTKEPLTLDEFNKVLKHIEKLSMQYENLHLVLSSFAVLNVDNKVVNTTLHVQCGKKPHKSN